MFTYCLRQHEEACDNFARFFLRNKAEESTESRLIMDYRKCLKCRIIRCNSTTLANRGRIKTGLLFAVFLLAMNLPSSTLFGQGVGINQSGNDPDPSSMLDINSTDRGLLIPRMTLNQRNSIVNPAEGLLIYQLDDSIGFWFYQNSSWRPLTIYVGSGTGLNGGPIRHSGTINIANTGVAGGTYGTPDSIPRFTVNEQGQLVFAGNIAILERDSVIGNEIADTNNARGMLEKYGAGTGSSPYSLGIAPGNSIDDIWFWNGTSWEPRPLPAEIDGVIGNEIADTSGALGILTLSGSGTGTDPYTVGIQRGNQNNDVWTWNGSKWVAAQIQMPVEKDSVIGNEIADTVNARGMINRFGAGTDANPYKIGVKPGSQMNDIWFWNGTSWVLGQIIHPPEKDSIVGNEITDTIRAYGFLRRYGTGTVIDPFKLGVIDGSTAGNVLTWTGGKWESKAIPIIPEVDGTIGNEITDTINARGMINRNGAGTTANPYRISINPGSNVDDVWFWNGSSWEPRPLPVEKDSAIGNEVSDTITGGFITISGSGTTSDPLSVGLKPGWKPGDYLRWNGNQWLPDTIEHHTLDKAYDQGGPGAGRTIIADAGAVSIQGTDGYEVTGTFRQGATVGNPGGGIRSFFNPRTAAFRAGSVSGTQWNSGNIGEFSFAAGRNVLASDNYSFALGFNATANRANAMALGDSVFAVNQHTYVFGNRSTASGVNSVALGYGNNITGQNSAGLGNLNKTEGAYSLTLGRGNVTKGLNSTALGYGDTASGDYSLSFGYESHAIGFASMAIGYKTITTNPYSVALGNYASAIADRSFALGSYVSTNNKNGSFILGDGSTTTVLNNSALNQFVARFDGGYILYTDKSLSTAVYLPNGAGSWSSTSDRNVKENIADINGEQILDSIRAMPITSWNYINTDSSVRYIGPMAQDFHRAFGLGGNDSLGINTVSIDGVNMAAVQALIIRTDELQKAQSEMEQQEGRIDELEAEIEELKKAMISGQRNRRRWFRRKK